MAYRGKTVAVIVPAFNEERLIGRVLSGMPAFVDGIVVVDDASRDRTADRVRESGDGRTMLLRHPSRRGVGAAIRTGYLAALERGCDIAAVMAGDAQMDPGDLPGLLDPLVDGRADYTKGNRLLSPGLRSSMPPLRTFGNYLLSSTTRLALGRRDIGDSQCGYTAISRGALQDLLLLPFCSGYGYPNEILCNLAILGKRVADIPVKAVYGEEKSGIFIPAYALKMSFVLTRCAVRRIFYICERNGFLCSYRSISGKKAPANPEP